MSYLNEESSSSARPADVLRELWTLGELDPVALRWATLSGVEPVLPSSFAVATAAQSSLAAAALAAAEIRYQRGFARQGVAVDMRHAAHECTTYFTLNGKTLNAWDKLSGLYRCKPGGSCTWARVHANFAHHRDGFLRLIGLPEGELTERDAVEGALQGWQAEKLEQAAAERGLVVAAARTFKQWDEHAQGRAVAASPLFSLEKIGEAPPRELPPLSADQTPLQGLRVLELTRIIAGPVAGRALAAYGAEVMLVNSPNLPNVGAIVETSRGKLSALVDLRKPEGKAALQDLVSGAHVFIQGYRPGGIDSLGFAPHDLARLSPGIVYVDLSAYGHDGPWADRRGFDSLVQTATGFNLAEAQAAGAETPRALPMQILDHATGLLMAYAAQCAILRQQREGGSWQVRLSLAHTSAWLRSLGRVPNGLQATKPTGIEDLLEKVDTGFGRLVAVRHAAKFEMTPVMWLRPSMPPGSSPARWPSTYQDLRGS
ncbi:CoA transferase [Rhizobacter sp. Root404]|uniref:CoA transferase n=1 Tax=Rhizobacter sp. Root404 TaxID=1736528 RepID=UPI000A9EBE89